MVKRGVCLMNNWQWKKKATLAEQLKFFGAKKQKFISVYAKKPRILVKVKESADEALLRIGKEQQAERASSRSAEINRESQLASLYQQQIQMGTQRSSVGCSQMAVAQQGMYGGQGGSGLHYMQLGGF